MSEQELEPFYIAEPEHDAVHGWRFAIRRLDDESLVCWTPYHSSRNTAIRLAEQVKDEQGLLEEPAQ